MTPPPHPLCADCACEIGHDHVPRDGWQLEDGRTVCQKCCVAELNRFHELIREYKTKPKPGLYKLAARALDQDPPKYADETWLEKKLREWCLKLKTK